MLYNFLSNNKLSLFIYQQLENGEKNIFKYSIKYSF